MNRTKSTTYLIVGALIFIGVYLGLNYRSVFASSAASQAAQAGQAATPTAEPGTPAQKPTAPKNWEGGRFGFNDQDLANALGISLDKLQVADQAAAAAALKEAVSKGLLTQQQADQLSARGFGLHHFRMPGKLGANGIDTNALLAQALGISTDQLQAAYQKALAASLDRAVQNGSLTQQQADLIKGREALAGNAKFQASLRSAFEAAVQQAVTDGVITQAQADQILANSMGGNRFFGPMGGFPGENGFKRGFGAFGKHKGGGPFNPANPSPTASPSSSSSGF